MRKHNYSKRVLVGAAAMTMLFAGSAFTASNSMPADTKAGHGTVAVSGYTAEKIDYTHADGNITSVAIHITGAVTDGSTAQLQLSTTGSWHGCTISALVDPDTTVAGDEYTPLDCTTTNEPVSGANDVALTIAD